MAQGAIAGGNPVEDVHTRTTASGPQSQVAVIGIDGSDSVIQASSARGLQVDPSGALAASARITIATAGTPSALSALSVGCKAIFVVALPTNTQRVAVGGITVDAADSTFNGIPLDPGQGVGFEVNNATGVYFDVLVDGNGVSWTATGV